MASKEEKLALYGLRLDQKARDYFDELGIYAKTSVARLYQSESRRYVIGGEESGGATAQVGRYVTFAGPNGEALPYVQLLKSIGDNGRHALIVAPVLLRVELLRIDKGCQLMLTRHYLESATERSGRTRLRSREVFPRMDGTLEIELWQKRGSPRNQVLPRFWSGSGEEWEIPEQFRAVIAAATLGASCLRCSHNHYSVAQVSDRSEPPLRDHSSHPDLGANEVAAPSEVVTVKD